ncbi:carbohydrate ABC transporter permease [Saccharibacillus sp. CPCC 101409]|uniref:carbohydrate ABC transporter permease n=1 Tax=Saccharibacillus sp. CPCC 101409 TaxID=3058041 RepID=UPI002673EC77|nr:carbohydrate ABC transporter permease [Saccharibacillus sp. CPCC 101409]MDO3408687.1 carbohydrate ABC transporter permease [Saccharibacillus sp. CPCC 101409]
MRKSLGERIGQAGVYIVLSAAGLLCLLPLVHIASMSLSSLQAVSAGKVTLYPVDFSFSAYRQLFEGTSIVNAFVNSVVITVVGVALSMLFTILAAYPLTRSYFWGRQAFTMGIVFTMLFGGGLIPTYLTVRNLGLIDSYWALWLPGLVSVFNLLVLRSFMQNIPEEVDDAARIDGCGEWRYLLRIVLPLSTPVLATLALFYGVGYWNSFFNVLMYINTPDKYNIAVLVQQMIQSQMMLAQMSTSSSSENLVLSPDMVNSAAIIVMVLPMLVVYPFLQKHFVKGVMIGAVKG